MHGGEAEPLHRLAVYGGRIPLMPGKAVIRPEAVQDGHHPVPQHFRDDRRRRDGRDEVIRSRKGKLGKRQLRDGKDISENFKASFANLTPSTKF